jgi:uncharacterized protein YvpB
MIATGKRLKLACDERFGTPNSCLMRVRTTLLAGATLVVAGCATGIIEPAHPTERPSEASSSRSAGSGSLAALSSAATSTEGTDELPRRVHLSVPFASQAPLGDWSDPRQQEGCEEMSVIMVSHFLEGTPMSTEQALEDLLALSTWEEEHGYGLDVNISELAAIVEDYYGYKTAISTEVTAENIRRELAAGHPVIVPAAGRLLGNPYFSGEGPWYHMLVIIGYDQRRFITNDPGTRRGENYTYDFDVLINAVHDWTGVKEDIQQGRKVMLILSK